MPYLNWVTGGGVTLRLDMDPPTLTVPRVECAHTMAQTLRLTLTEGGVTEVIDFPPNGGAPVEKRLTNRFTFASPRQDAYHPNFSTQFGPAPATG